jgi:hypothetical protein
MDQSICIHGLNSVNCPICRIEKHTYPDQHLKNIKNKDNPLLESLHQSVNIDIIENTPMKNKLDQKGPISDLKIITPHVHSPLVKKLPDFKNRIFMKRMEEIKQNNPDKFGISKKISLKSPKWKLKKEIKENKENS